MREWSLGAKAPALLAVAAMVVAAACSSASNNNTKNAPVGAASAAASVAPAAGSATAASTAAAAGGNITVPQSVVAADKALADAAGKGSPIDQVTISRPVTINFWEPTIDNTPAGLKLAAIIKDFEAKNPNITVNAQYVGTYNDEFQKNQTAIAGGQTPDLSVAYENEVATYQQANVIVPLEDYIKSQKYGLIGDDYSDILQSYRYDNFYATYQSRLLSFPWQKSVEMLYYNADLLKAAGVSVPQTWDDFLTAAKTLTKGDVKGYPIGIDASRFATGIYSRGGAILSDDQKKAVFNNPQGVAQLTFYQQVLKDGAGYVIAKSGDDQADFIAGKAAFFLASSTRISQLQANVPKGGNFTWGAAVPPHGAGLPQVTDMYGGNVTIFKSTPEKQLAAWLLIKYFNSRDVNPDWSVNTGYLPVRTSALNSDQVKGAVQNIPQYAIAVQSQQYGRPEPNVRQWNALRSAIEDAMVAATSDPKKDAKALLDDAVNRANQALSQ